MPGDHHENDENTRPQRDGIGTAGSRLKMVDRSLGKCEHDALCSVRQLKHHIAMTNLRMSHKYVVTLQCTERVYVVVESNYDMTQQT